MDQTFSLCITVGDFWANDGVQCNRLYEDYYKSIAAWFYHEKLPFSWALSASQLEYLDKKHPEFINILGDMSSGKLLEFLSGGYYNPVFPLISTADCVAQIELFVNSLRRTVGQTPDGVGFSPDVWDPRLIIPFVKSGMKFVELNADLIPPEINSFSPLLLENLGRTLAVLPVFPDLLPDPQDTPVNWLEHIHDVFTFATRFREKNANLVAILRFPPDLLATLTGSPWFQDFSDSLKKYMPSLKLTTPSAFLAKTNTIFPAYVGAKKEFYDEVRKNRSQCLLYSRLLYLRLLVDQCRGDKTRKKEAAEKLWQAQEGKTFSGDSSPGLLRRSYQNIIFAEKVTREVKPVTGFISMISFDFDFDGVNEYLCRFEAYNAFVGSRGGSIFELDVFQSATNCVGSKGFFVDHLLNADWSKDFSGFHLRDSLFQNLRYTEVVFHRNRRELRMKAVISFGPNSQEIVLNKNYTFNNNSIQVQYVVTNKSAFVLESFFAVESTYVFLHSEVKIEKVPFHSSEIFCVQLTDKAHNVSIVLEPNEVAGFSVSPSSEPLATIFYWPCKIDSERQIEKTITLTINTPKKKGKR